MRIKFLSVIVSFLFVSFFISSCLDSEKVEYSTDATIHAFGLDTIYGKHYKFTIDQLKGEIYNEDSLPVWADTIIDRILIDTMSIAGGIVTSRNAEGQDTLFNTADSMDLRKPITVKVWAPDGSVTKEYVIKVNVHQQDPDSLNWGAPKGEAPRALKTGFSGGKIIGKQKSVILNNDLIVYSISNNQVVGYKTPTKATGNPSQPASGTNWTALSTINGLPATVELSSILTFNNDLYAVAGNTVYFSANGVDWTLHPTLNQYPVTALLVAYPSESNGNLHNTIGIAGIVQNGTTNTFAMTDRNAASWELGEQAPDGFPVYNISSNTYTSSTGILGAMLMGSTTPDMSETRTETTPWGSYNGTSWADLSISSLNCPVLDYPTMLHYNGQFYAFGNDFSQFYSSPTGITWYETSDKFFFPEGMTARKGGYYSAVVDDNNFIWITCSNNTADGNDTTTGTDDVWRARLNKLSFASYTAKK